MIFFQGKNSVQLFTFSYVLLAVVKSARGVVSWSRMALWSSVGMGWCRHVHCETHIPMRDRRECNSKWF